MGHTLKVPRSYFLPDACFGVGEAPVIIPKARLDPFFFFLLASIKSRRLNHDGMTSNDAIHISRTTAVHLRVRGSCFFWSSGPLIIRSLAPWHGRRGSGQRAVEPAELSRGNQCFLPGAIIYSRP